MCATCAYMLVTHMRICVHAGFYDATVMDTFANEAMRRIDEFSQQNLVRKLLHFWS